MSNCFVCFKQINTTPVIKDDYGHEFCSPQCREKEKVHYKEYLLWRDNKEYLKHDDMPWEEKP